MRKYIILLCLLILIGLFCLYKYSPIKEVYEEVIPTVNITLNDNLNVNVYDEVYLSNFIQSINGTYEDTLIDTSMLGEKDISFTYINDDNLKASYSFVINVVDNEAPILWLTDAYAAPVGSKDIKETIMCGDNYDDKPECTIEGEYDMNTPGEYSLVYKVKDSSGNEAEKSFTLNVYVPGNASGYTSKKYFKDIYNKYKTDNNKIGIDISEWQGDVDFEKIKNAGCEFVFIRVGGTKGIKKDYFVDSEFVNNIKKANEIGMSVGVYFYAYTSTYEDAVNDAKWVLEQIKDYQVDLEIAFDWENWNSFNKYNVSFYKLTNIANTFIKVIEDNGYKGMLYSSKTYLENIWMKNDNEIWLAHYTDNTTYEGDYKYWQLTSIGVIDGINGYVDVDIMIEK